MLITLQLLLASHVLTVLTIDGVYSSPLQAIAVKRNSQESTFDSITTINSKHIEAETSFVSDGKRSSIISDSYSTENSLVATEDKRKRKIFPKQNYNVSIRLRKRAVSEKVNGDDVADLKKASESEARASAIPFLPSGKDGTSDSGSGGVASGLASQVSGMLPNSSATSSDGKLVMGAFSLYIMPMGMSNMVNALQTGQQLSSMLPGMPSLPG